VKVGLIDVDGHNFPNIPLMKLSAWHKKQGDSVEWYSPILSCHMDVVYCAKVFSFTPDYQYPIDADKIVKGGTGYCIDLQERREVYHDRSAVLPDHIEHMYPDYELYGIANKAYGFLSRGCPRGCFFCHVKSKEGTKAYKVADLDEFWKGQKEIEVCDPNILAVPEAEDLLQQLADSKAKVDINQGLDARLLTERKIEIIRKIRMKYYHFAWDNPKDEDKILPKLKMFVDIVKPYKKNVVVYCLTNFNSSLDEDFHRIYTLRELGVSPYIMIYDKEHADPIYRKIQRWVNAPQLFWSTKTFEEYKRK
jgi:hypothetical protein